MADQEIRKRRVVQEKGEGRKQNRSAKVFKIDKDPEPTNWFFIIELILLVMIVVLTVIDAISGFKMYSFFYNKISKLLWSN
ncbi:unnamed protein product [Caenorhabditis bovis]|uniref:Uncharacterized protein n=1 Tax=Caenorhabditis bovis TaxID=2654633 RepID=A0A8S1EEL2_9PELO|nr:unnamed protein product [Caenorhabditis bovis]